MVSGCTSLNCGNFGHCLEDVQCRDDDDCTNSHPHCVCDSNHRGNKCQCESCRQGRVNTTCTTMRRAYGDARLHVGSDTFTYGVLGSSCGVDVKCMSIKTKYDSYCSFRVDCDESCMKRLLQPSMWPVGILVRSFV